MLSKEKFQVLILAGHSSDAALCIEMLASSGCMGWSVAETLAEAMGIIEGGGIDLLVLDPSLPNGGGIDSFDKVHSLFPDLPVIVLAGKEHEETGSKIVNQGAQDCLVKGEFDSRDLIQSIRCAIRVSRVEASLVRERNMFKVLMDHVTDHIYFKDRRSRFLRASKSLALFFKLEDQEQLLGKADFDFFTSEHAQPARDDELEVMRTGEAIVDKVEKETKSDGSVNWTLTTKMPWIDDFGKIIGTFGISRDITKIKTMDAALASERNLLRSVIDNVPDRILLKDHQGRYMLSNVAHSRFLGVDDPKETLGKTLGHFLPPAVVAQRTADDDEVLKTGKPLISKEELMENAAGVKQWLSTTKVPLRDAEGKILGIVVISRDITEHKLAQEEVIATNKRLREAVIKLKNAHDELHSLQLQLIEAEKMKSIGRLSAGVAHEVKNPLAIIDMGLAYLLQADGFAAGAEVPQVLKEMRDAVQRADAVVKGLLDFSAPKQLDVQDEDINEIIEKSLILVRGEMKGPRFRVVKEFNGHLPLLKLDRLKIEQVFVNLFTNAIHAMPKGGTLTIRSSFHQHAGVGENVGDSRSESFRIGGTLVVVEIEDEGTGIPADKLTKIFDPFFTTKTTGEGTGLGLSVTKTIIDLHRGTIEIHNRQEGGARVTLMFEV